VAAGVPGGVSVRGWALDPDTGDATVTFTVDGAAAATLPTDAVRGDVGAAYPGRGDLHGFAGVVRAGGGARTLCGQVDNQAGGSSRSLGCRTVQVPAGNPTGNYEAAIAASGGTRVAGWVLDPDSVGPVSIHVYTSGGAWVTAATADRPRPDVGAAYAGYGDDHGFDLVVPVPPGTGLCVYAINIGQGTTNPLMGCRTG